jgi:hypothetical protein
MAIGIARQLRVARGVHRLAILITRPSMASDMISWENAHTT